MRLPGLAEGDMLPTIFQSYRPVEEYLEFLHEAGCPAPPDVVRPCDALALRLLLRALPAPPTLVDLAGDASSGVTSVLCCSQIRVAKVIGVRPAARAAHAAWERVLQDYFAGYASPQAPFSACRGEAAGEATARAGGSLATLVILATTGETADSLLGRATHWSGLGRGVVVCILGVGETGHCEYLAALARAFGSRSGRRFALLREQASALHDSRLGLVYDQSHAHVEDTLARVRHWFTGNFAFLELAKFACTAASDAAECDRRLACAEEELRCAKAEAATAEHELRCLRAEMAMWTGSLPFKLVARMSRARHFLAPDGTGRGWAFQKLVRPALVKVCRATLSSSESPGRAPGDHE